MCWTDGLASSQPGQACGRENAGTGNPLMLPYLKEEPAKGQRGADEATYHAEKRDGGHAFPEAPARRIKSQAKKIQRPIGNAQAITDGSAPAGLTVSNLTQALPHAWTAQEQNVASMSRSRSSPAICSKQCRPGAPPTPLPGSSTSGALPLLSPAPNDAWAVAATLGFSSFGFLASRFLCCPRAKIMQRICHDVLKELGIKDSPLLEVAMALLCTSHGVIAPVSIPKP